MESERKSPEKFRRHRKCFGEKTEKVSERPKNSFGVNHQAKKVLACAWNFLGGVGNVLGPSGIFLERTGVKNTMSRDGGQDPTFRGECFVGRPFRVQPPFGGMDVGGPPWWEASSHKPWSMVWGGGAPHEGAPRGWPGQACLPMELPPTFGGLLCGRGGPFGPSSSCLPQHLSHTINRGGEGSPNGSQVSHTNGMQ